MVFNYLKAGIAALCVISVTLLMAIKSIESAAGMPIIALVVGYALGNGVATKQGITSQPLMGPSSERLASSEVQT